MVGIHAEGWNAYRMCGNRTRLGVPAIALQPGPSAIRVPGGSIEVFDGILVVAAVRVAAAPVAARRSQEHTTAHRNVTSWRTSIVFL